MLSPPVRVPVVTISKGTDGGRAEPLDPKWDGRYYTFNNDPMSFMTFIPLALYPATGLGLIWLQDDMVVDI